MINPRPISLGHPVIINRFVFGEGRIHLRDGRRHIERERRTVRRVQNTIDETFTIDYFLKKRIL